MLRFDVMRVMKLRGIQKPWVFLMENGFTRSASNNFFSGNVLELKIWQIEKLCLLLNCTPSDLFDWEPSEHTSAGENHAMRALIREKSAPTIADIVKDLPIEKMEEIGEMLKQLKEKD